MGQFSQMEAKKFIDEGKEQGMNMMLKVLKECFELTLIVHPDEVTIMTFEEPELKKAWEKICSLNG